MRDSKLQERAGWWPGLALVLCLAPYGVASAHPGHGGHDGHGEAPAADPGITNLQINDLSPEREYFTDTLLLDHEGHARRFYSDVLHERVVLINFIFTDCPEFCPMMTRKLSEVRARLRGAAEDVLFVSISINPERDTPEVLRDFRERHGVADVEDWLFLTGEPDNVRNVALRLGETAREPDDHSTLVLAGNVSNRAWAKIPPHAPPMAIVLKLEELAGVSLAESLP